MTNTKNIEKDTNKVNNQIERLNGFVPKSDEEIKKIMKKPFEKYWEIEVICGNHKEYRLKTFAVKLINKLLPGEDPVYLYDYFSNNKKEVEKDLNNHGFLEDSAIDQVYDYVKELKKSGNFLVIDSLEEYLSESTSIVEAEEYYKKILDYVRHNQELFVSKEENEYNPKIHKGVWLDNKWYMDKYEGEVLLAVKCDVARYIIEPADKKRYAQIKKGLKDLGKFMPGKTSDGRLDITLGNSKTEKCLIFRIDKNEDTNE